MKTPEEIKKWLECCSSAEIMCGECPYYEDGVDCDGMEEDTLAYIRQLEERVPKWISVEERLPERDMRVAVLYRFPRSKQLFSSMLEYYAADPEPHFQHTLGEGGPIVCHWMPLPEPPKEG